MHWSMLLMYGLVLVLALVCHSRILAALLGAWFIGEVYALYSGDHLPFQLYLLLDAAAFALIAAWARTSRDWMVVAIYPVMWAAYLMPIEAAPKWWLLYWLALTQFVIAAPIAITMLRPEAVKA